MAENTLKRLKQFLDFKGIKVSAFEKEVGMSNGSFASQLKNDKTIGVDKLENILKKYPDINIEWLLTGNGDMIKWDLLNEDAAIYSKTPKDDSGQAVNYKELAESRKETIESLKKVILYLEAQIETKNQKKK